MKTFPLVLCLLLITSCSTQKNSATDIPKTALKFTVDKNCSERALNKIAEYDKNSPHPEYSEKIIKEIQEEVRKAIPDARTCYQNELDGMYATNEASSVCVVIGTSKSGNLNFVDVENRSQPLSAKLKNCLVDAFSKVDVRKAKDVMITQPLNLIPKKK